MTFKEWLKYATKNRSDDYIPLLPELKLNDGTELSVQASVFHMCNPKKTLYDGEYNAVEVYTHGVQVYGLYGLYEASDWIYPNIDVDFMEHICQLHGGINEQEVTAC